MAYPWELLETAALAVVPEGVSVYGAPADQIVPPALVIRPDTPWREPESFCNDHQRYVAIAVVSAASMGDGGQRKIYDIHSALILALPEGWSFDSVTGPVIDETTGSQLIAAALRLSYRNNLEDE